MANTVPNYEVFKKGKCSLWVGDWAEEWVMISYLTEQGWTRCEVTYREAVKLVKGIREMLNKSGWEFVYVKTTKKGNIKVERQDEKIEIGVEAYPNIFFLWLSLKEANRLIWCIEKVLEDVKARERGWR